MNCYALENKENELMQQITSLKKEIMDLEVYKELLFTKNNLTIHVKLAIFIDS